MDRKPRYRALNVLTAAECPVVDRHIGDLLRELRITEVTSVKSMDHARWQLQHSGKKFGLVICDKPGDQGHHSLLQFVRWDQGNFAPSLPIICVADVWTSAELVATRDAGATAALSMPITKQTLLSAAASRFIMAPTFRGVDRRGAGAAGYSGPFRRADDDKLRQKSAAPPVVSTNEEVASLPTRGPESSLSSTRELASSVAWSMAIETGQKEVDDEHRIILEILGELRTASNNGADAIQTIFARLRDYLKVHFAHEEQLMDRFEYDERDRHKRLHAKFAEKVNRIDLDRVGGSVGRQRLYILIYEWLMSHIADVDRVMIAKLNGEFYKEEDGSYGAQTAIVIDDAYKTAGHIQRMSVQLAKIGNSHRRAALCHRIADATERLINLLVLADSRIEARGCTGFQLCRLRDIRAAALTNADSLIEAAARNLVRYGPGIILGKHGIPFGVGAVVSQQMARVSTLVAVIGGADAMSELSRTAVAQATDIVAAIVALESSAAVELPDLGAPPAAKAG